MRCARSARFCNCMPWRARVSRSPIPPPPPTHPHPPTHTHTLQGVLLQIFTKPLGDRPTVFIEIIQRLCEVPPPPPQASAGWRGCGGGSSTRPPSTRLPACTAAPARPPARPPPSHAQEGGTAAAPALAAPPSARRQLPAEVGGCGGFGKGNFRWVVGGLPCTGGSGQERAQMRFALPRPSLAPPHTPPPLPHPLYPTPLPHPPHLQRAVQEHRGV